MRVPSAFTFVLCVCLPRARALLFSLSLSLSPSSHLPTACSDLLFQSHPSNNQTRNRPCFSRVQDSTLHPSCVRLCRPQVNRLPRPHCRQMYSTHNTTLLHPHRQPCCCHDLVAATLEEHSAGPGSAVLDEATSNSRQYLLTPPLCSWLLMVSRGKVFAEGIVIVGDTLIQL